MIIKYITVAGWWQCYEDIYSNGFRVTIQQVVSYWWEQLQLKKIRRWYCGKDERVCAKKAGG